MELAEIAGEKRKISRAIPFILFHVFLERYCTAGIACDYFFYHKN